MAFNVIVWNFMAELETEIEKLKTNLGHLLEYYGDQRGHKPRH